MIESGGPDKGKGEERSRLSRMNQFTSGESQNFSSEDDRIASSAKGELRKEGSGFVYHVKDRGKPSLGERPDFDKIDAERIHALPGLDKERAQHLLTHLPAITEEINGKRRELGLEPVPYDQKNYKFVEPDEYSINPTIKAFQPDLSSAFYDTNTGLIVMSNETELDNPRANDIWQLYGATHEATHKGSHPGIGDYSYVLDEGIVDEDARSTFDKVVLPKILSPDDITRKNSYYTDIIVPSKFAIAGVPVQERDIIFVPDRGEPVAYSRIPELSVASAMKERNPEAYQDLRAAAYKGDLIGAKDIVKKAFGSHVAEVLGVSRQEAKAQRLPGIKAIGDMIRNKEK